MHWVLRVGTVAGQYRKATCQPQGHSQGTGPLGLAWIRVLRALGWVPFMGWMQQWGFGFQSVLTHNFVAGSFLPSNGCVALGDGRGSL